MHNIVMICRWKNYVLTVYLSILGHVKIAGTELLIPDKLDDVLSILNALEQL